MSPVAFVGRMPVSMLKISRLNVAGAYFDAGGEGEGCGAGVAAGAGGVPLLPPAAAAG
jgi:hypothetical protein